MQIVNFVICKTHDGITWLTYLELLWRQMAIRVLVCQRRTHWPNASQAVWQHSRRDTFPWLKAWFVLVFADVNHLDPILQLQLGHCLHLSNWQKKLRETTTSTSIAHLTNLQRRFQTRLAYRQQRLSAQCPVRWHMPCSDRQLFLQYIHCMVIWATLGQHISQLSINTQ